jgi:hypothetical protein
VRQDRDSKSVQFNLHHCSGKIVEVGLGVALSLSSFTYICGDASGSGIGSFIQNWGIHRKLVEDMYGKWHMR